MCCCTEDGLELLWWGADLTHAIPGDQKVHVDSMIHISRVLSDIDGIHGQAVSHVWN